MFRSGRGHRDLALDRENTVEKVSVAIETGDPVGGRGLSSALARSPEIRLIDPARCDLLILLTDRVDDQLLAVMRKWFEARSGGISCIVIANEITEEQVAVAAGLGLIALWQRADLGPDQVRESVLLTRSVRPALPSAVLPLMLQRFRETAEPAACLSELEAQVLRLYADGLSSADVARELGLPGPRISRIVLDVRRRLNLRTRTHAVAYAVRREMDG
jgi:DNA-binding NarL/FixJ family response regulator